MPLTPQQLLDDAERAYHLLMTGKSSRVVVDGNNGTRIEFTATNKVQLYNYIQQLRLQVNGSPPTPDNSPAGFIF
jgi:hypothetical protein